jgi:hypothetical protein
MYYLQVLQLIVRLHFQDRARIQAKRRPPSRRARQEAVRTSGIIFEGLDTVDDIQESAGVSCTGSQPSPSGIVHSPFKPQSPTFVGSSALPSPSTDEDDLFGVPQDLPSEYGSSKDDDQSLFSSAPVLSPLEPLSKIPMERNLPKRASVESPERDTLLANKLLEDSLDDVAVPASHISSNEDRVSVSDLSGDKPEIQPPLKVLHDTEKKTELFSGTENQELSATDNLVPSVKPIPESNASSTVVGKPGNLSDSLENADSSLKDCLSSKEPIFLDDRMPPMLQNMQESESHEQLFRRGSVKDSAEILDDLFSTATLNKSILSDDVNDDDDDDDDLFSSDAKTSANKDIKKMTSVNKSVIIEPKEVYDISFVSGEEQKQSLPTDKDLLSKNIEVANTQNSNYGLFVGDNSPEFDDLFVATSAKKAGNPVIKGSVTSSMKSSLFDDDDGDDLFGSAKSASKSALSAKPMNSKGQYYRRLKS